MQKIKISKNLPRFLLIGATNAGKSSFIGQAGFRLLTTETTKQGNWWCNSEAAVLDVPGYFLDIWDQFLVHLQRYTRRKSFAGILVALDLSTWGLLKKVEQQNVAKKINEALQSLYKHNKIKCPSYLVLTKTDRIAGFREFFSNLSPEERAKTFGIDLATSSFKIQLEALIKKLYNSVTKNIQQEYNAQKRILIPYFPLQLESLKENLVHLAQKITNLKAVYFTSSLQQEIPIDYLAKTSSNPSQTLRFLPETQRPYFIQQLFRKLVLNIDTEKSYARFLKLLSPHEKYKRYIVHTASILLIALSCGWIAHTFKIKATAIASAQQALATYKVFTQQLTPDTPHGLNQILPPLNSLHQVVTILEQTYYWHQQNSVNLATKTYHQALVNYFLPTLGTSLEQSLIVNSTDPILLYGALKTYLMLGDPSHFNATFVKNWLFNYWQQIFPNNITLQNQLADHLNALIDRPLPPLELNQQAIASARNALAKLSSLELAYAILKNQADINTSSILVNSNKQLAFLNTTFSANKNSVVISSLYTRAQFNNIYSNKIRQAALVALNGDWILGKHMQSIHPNNNNPIVNTLTKDLQTLYLQDYANHWLTLLANLHIAPWKNWQQADIALSNLVSPTSPLAEILKTISINTTVLPNVRPLSPDILARVTPAISDLQKYLHHIEKANNSNEAAFFATKAALIQINKEKNPIQRLHEIATTLPSPLREWIEELANNSWRLLLDQTAQYLDDIWQSKIATFYQAKLANHYPLFKNSFQDASLTDFTTFFAPGGIMSNYLSTYLLPYLDTSRSEWHWRNLNGQTLILAPDLLSQLERADILRSMFFGNNLHPGLKFTLQPISFGPGVDEVVLNLNEQIITDSPDNKASHTLSWPTSGNITLSFTNNQDQQATLTYNGPWALFRLLDKSNLQPTKGTQQFEFILDLNGNAARYQLSTPQAINPFIAGIIEQFRCPDKIA